MVYLKLEDSVSLDEMLNKLAKELDTTKSQIKRLETLLASDFGEKAPPQIVENERIKLETFKLTAQKIKDQMKTLH